MTGVFPRSPSQPSHLGSHRVFLVMLNYGYVTTMTWENFREDQLAAMIEWQGELPAKQSHRYRLGGNTHLGCIAAVIVTKPLVFQW